VGLSERIKDLKRYSLDIPAKAEYLKSEKYDFEVDIVPLVFTI